MINIAEKLKGCPQGTKLYSPLFGEAGPIPDNIIFSKEWIDTGKL